MTAFGVFASGAAVRWCGIDADGSVWDTGTLAVSPDLTIDDYLDPDDRLADLVSDALPDPDVPLYLALPGGAYQMRRVPLEVAEEVDRRSQVVWEVNRSLDARDGDYDISYFVRGSAAVWVAVPTACRNALAAAFEKRGRTVEAACAAPVALVHAVRPWAGPVACILQEGNWASVIRLRDGALVSGATRRLGEGGAPDADTIRTLCKQAGVSDDEKLVVSAEPFPDEGLPPGAEPLRLDTDGVAPGSLTAVAVGAAAFGSGERLL